ncbi:hypothetical protein B0J17DRAFT_389961 [Rhizoctonia solani]|nr:hypothetical protein B0J17DRAFT_389961 [Rhizoctonia solani]
MLEPSKTPAMSILSAESEIKSAVRSRLFHKRALFIYTLRGSLTSGYATSILDDSAYCLPSSLSSNELLDMSHSKRLQSLKPMNMEASSEENDTCKIFEISFLYLSSWRYELAIMDLFHGSHSSTFISRPTTIQEPLWETAMALIGAQVLNFLSIDREESNVWLRERSRGLAGGDWAAHSLGRVGVLLRSFLADWKSRKSE